jgi:DNA replication ATP-dependent helicase Dna2
MLKTTYRMNEEINRYPSQRFYEGKLTPASSAAHRTLSLNGRPGTYADFLEPAPSSIFVEVDHVQNGMRSEQEARIAAGIVQEALQRGLSETEIAVVAPYRAQVRLIRNALYRMGVEVGGEAVVVDTVERIQGQERDIIIFSLTTSDPGHAAERADFYFQPNRLNVAITRPRKKRIVIGNPRLLDPALYPADHRAWVEHFQGLYQDSATISVD